MTPQQRLREAIDARRDRLRASVPADRKAAIRALVRRIDGLAVPTAEPPRFDLLTGHQRPALGANTALCLALEAPAEPAAQRDDAGADAWADAFLRDSGHVARAELVMGHSESGFMRLLDGSDGAIDAWVATKVMPPSWRERADVDTWAAVLARRQARETGVPEPERRALGLLASMAWQLAYPPDTSIGSLPLSACRAVVGALLAMALDPDSILSGRALPERALVAAIASRLRMDPGTVAAALAALILEPDAARWHAAVPGIAVPPIVRAGPDRLMVSRHGLSTEPLLFLARELRRRDPQAWHNAASLREDVFRQDLYALFADRRFVTSAGPIRLRRDDRRLRTDIDAAVFDRRTGALGVFELKAQDPFARSAAETARQRDNMLQASRQIAAILDWINRNGADEVLNRIDRQAAKRFRVARVVPFVLGRFVAHAGDGPADRRAAWGTWPQVLRLLEGEAAPGRDANPIASLHGRLLRDPSPITVPSDVEPVEIPLGGVIVRVYPSWAALHAGTRG